MERFYSVIVMELHDGWYFHSVKSCLAIAFWSVDIALNRLMPEDEYEKFVTAFGNPRTWIKIPSGAKAYLDELESVKIRIHVEEMNRDKEIVDSI